MLVRLPTACCLLTSPARKYGFPFFKVVPTEKAPQLQVSIFVNQTFGHIGKSTCIQRNPGGQPQRGLEGRSDGRAVSDNGRRPHQGMQNHRVTRCNLPCSRQCTSVLPQGWRVDVNTASFGCQTVGHPMPG